MRARRSIAIIVLIAAVLMFLWAAYLFPPQGVRELRVATLRGACGISFTEVMDALGIDKRVGLDVVMVPLEGVPVEVEALLRGEVDLAIVPVEFLPPYIGRGAELRLLLLDMTQYQALVVRPGIGSLRELEGRTLGAFFPTSTYLSLKAYLLEAGLRITERSPGRGEVAIVNIPVPALADALERGDVDGVATIGPSTMISLAKGGRLLATFSQMYRGVGLRGAPPLITFITTESKLRERGGAIETLLNARSVAVREWESSDELVDKLYVERCGLSRDMANSYRRWLLDYIWRGGYLDDAVVTGITEYLTLLAKHGVIEIGPDRVPGVVNRLLGR